jgi:hypothetical protein
MNERRRHLLEVERKLWLGSEGEYRNALDDDCLVAFTSMAGVSSRDAIANQADAQRWQRIDMDVEGYLEPTEDVALLTYRASAVRGNGEPYEARVSSGYVRRDGSWKLMFHAQTPLRNGQQRG